MANNLTSYPVSLICKWAAMLSRNQYNMHGWRRFTRAAFLHVVPLCRREHQVALHVSKCVRVLLLSCVRARQEHVASIRENRWRPTAAQVTRSKNTLPGSGVEDFASRALCSTHLPVHLFSPALPALLSLRRCSPRQEARAQWHCRVRRTLARLLSSTLASLPQPGLTASAPPVLQHQQGPQDAARPLPHHCPACWAMCTQSGPQERCSWTLGCS